MIQVRLSGSERSKKIRITVKGHAQTAAKGADLVCAAASMVSMMIAQHIRDMNLVPGFFKKTPNVMVVSGDALVECVCADKEKYALLRHDLIVLTRGFYLLEHNYEGRVRVAGKGDFEAVPRS